MSSLFRHSDSLYVSITLKQEIGKGGVNTVLVGRDVWKYLTSSDPVSERIAVCLSPCREPSIMQKIQSGSTLKSLTCWAALDAQTDDLAVPPRWYKHYTNVLRSVTQHHSNTQKTHVLCRVQPVLLAQVFLMALSQEAYDVAQSPDSFLEQWFFDTPDILRQGDVYAFGHGYQFIWDDKESSSYQYRLIMAEPVIQGYAQRGTTLFTLLYPSISESEVSPSTEHQRNLTVGPADHRWSCGDGPSGTRDAIEIDENFLASSVLYPAAALSRFSGAPSETSPSNDDAVESSARSSCLVFRTQSLSTPISLMSDDHTIYICTADLCRLGALSDYWVMARSCHTENYRFVRVSADDGLVHKSGIAVASPILLHNITSEFPTMQAPPVCLILAPLGSYQPSIPLAQEVTIARVASPFTVDRAYQPLILRSIKDYFIDTLRFIRPGDIIATGISTDSSLYLPRYDLGTERGEEEEEWTHMESLNSNVRVDEIVFFVVTKVQCSDSTGDDDITFAGLYPNNGELGCWVDPSVTRMIQAGVEHRRVPEAIAFTRKQMGSEKSLDVKRLAGVFGMDGPFSKLYQLSSVALARHVKDYDLHLSVLLKGKRGTGKFAMVRGIARQLGVHLLETNCYDILSENDTKTEGTLRAQFDKAASCSPCILVLRHIEAFGNTGQSIGSGKDAVIAIALHECIDEMQENWKLTGFPVIVCGTSSDPSRFSTSLLACFKHEIDFESPGESQRLEILDSLVADTAYAPDVSLSNIAKHTAALVASDLVNLVACSRSSSIERVGETLVSRGLLSRASIQISETDFDMAIAKARMAYSESIGTPKIPNVSWDDVGGLITVKAEIMDTIQLPLERPDLFVGGLKKRSGILLHGPPGTGKTLLAKAVATSCALNFFSVKGPELLNMYIGESEANVRRVFQQARDAKPCVIFFDELDSVAPKRGNHGDSGGVMDRIVSQLLAELDGISGDKSMDLFVIGATNRPDLLDPALLRPGRFDRLLYLGVSKTHDAQLEIITALTRQFKLHPALDLRQVAEQCPFTYTGADFYALCSDAMLNAMSRKAEELDARIATLNRSPACSSHPYPLTPQYYLAEMASQADIEVLVLQEDFERALLSLVPSVSQSEMDHYNKVQSRFSNGT